MDSMKNGMKVLSIHHIGDSPDEDSRIALSYGSIKMVASKDIRKHDRELKQITVHFADGEVIGFNISAFELQTLEEVVAGYSEDMY